MLARWKCPSAPLLRVIGFQDTRDERGVGGVLGGGDVCALFRA